MALYQIATVTDAKIETGNYIMYVGTLGATAAAAGWVNLGSGMLKNMDYVMEPFTSQGGNSVDPLEGIARETAKLSFDLVEYDGSSFSFLSGGAMTGTSGSAVVGGQTSVLTGKGMKLGNTRKLASGSTQTTTYVLNKCFLDNGWTVAFKSDNDTDPIAVYSFAMTAKQYATAGTIYTKTVA